MGYKILFVVYLNAIQNTLQVALVEKLCICQYNRL
nr:MAG TPA: hypothetical protein [Caudoviricetes sp.]